MPNPSRPVFIDTDTASDDAVALVIALRHPAIDVIGIGVVAGNVPLEMGVQNALYTAELCGVEIAVHAGEAAPLIVPLETGQHVHGHDGMGEIGLPLTGRRPSGRHAVDALIEASHTYAGSLELVTLGPLTNIARAVTIDPTLPDRLARTVVMGAVADHIGNQSPVAEFNMWVDPHAVQIVLDSGLHPEFVGWDISRTRAVMTPDDAARLRGVGTPLAEFCVDIQRVLSEFCHTHTKLAGFDYPDPIAMAYAIDPALATETAELNCVVETESPITRGMVVMDRLGFTGRAPNATVVLDADRERFLEMLFAAVA